MTLDPSSPDGWVFLWLLWLWLSLALPEWTRKDER